MSGKLTPAVHEIIVRAVRRGGNYTDAATLAGIHAKTISEWRRRGEDGEEPYAALLKAMNVADAERAMDMTDAYMDLAKSEDPEIRRKVVTHWLMSHRPREWAPASRAPIQAEGDASAAKAPRFVVLLTADDPASKPDGDT